MCFLVVGLCFLRCLLWLLSGLVALCPDLSPFWQGFWQGKSLLCAFVVVRCKLNCIICMVFGSGFPHKLDHLLSIHLIWQFSC
jgi:hypothetical protein